MRWDDNYKHAMMMMTDSMLCINNSNNTPPQEFYIESFSRHAINTKFRIPMRYEAKWRPDPLFSFYGRCHSFTDSGINIIVFFVFVISQNYEKLDIESVTLCFMRYNCTSHLLLSSVTFSRFSWCVLSTRTNSWPLFLYYSSSNDLIALSCKTYFASSWFEG